ncbi:hypothetical protein LXL04_038743 [Taraxacum kok-saghyz]
MSTLLNQQKVNTLFGKDRLDIFSIHTNKKGKFEDPVDDKHYNELCREFHEETQVLALSSSSQTRVNETAVFEKVLGFGRERIKDIGIKPPIMPTSSQYYGGHPGISQET